MIRRPPRSTLSSSSAASDVYKRQQMKIDTANPVSNISLIVRNNCNMIICLNYNTIFTLAKKVSTAIFKETIDTSYYKDFGHAARKKIDEYIQLGVSFAVPLSFKLK
eukprot:TRINITY_DN15579_c0_g1_i2.p1 TRINITY_DN15579_c0_g1~~TRINITY_DN15579_c0_g1_i2.p1  ORF type:complete len:114 (-),score=19.12 TRINITY_DN15579_c0_g1_i2:209-529(-)